jgi:hypothetical protein
MFPSRRGSHNNPPISQLVSIEIGDRTVLDPPLKRLLTKRCSRNECCLVNLDRLRFHRQHDTNVSFKKPGAFGHQQPTGRKAVRNHLSRGQSSRYRQTAEAKKDFVDLERLGRAEQETRLLELAESGDKIGAITVARKLYSYDLATAKDFVEGLINERSKA